MYLSVADYLLSKKRRSKYNYFNLGNEPSRRRKSNNVVRSIFKNMSEHLHRMYQMQDKTQVIELYVML